jgi:CheY-like chemotaxis protein/anti-sigma regulatory factor (Ser/Thr protein kinase)
MVGPLLEERQHTLEILVPRHGCSLHADQERLSQVLTNLLTNAAKYSEPHGSIQVTGRREGPDVVVDVHDSGVGIEPELQGTVFDIFTQGRQTLDRSEGGLGLGLAIVHSLVTLHGGTVTVFSEGQGRGATFTVRLPYVEMAHDEAERDDRPAIGTAATHARRILIVDDNRDAAELLAMALTAFGYPTQVAFDAAGALKAIDECVPDIALLDIGLPVMSGYELAKTLRGRPESAHISLVAVTGYGQQTDRAASAAAGFDAHLVKPVDLRELEQLVAGLVRDRHPPVDSL